MQPDHPEIITRIGTRISPTDKEALKQLLIEYQDIFVCSHEEMSSIDRAIIEHHLGVDPAYKPVHQKRKSFRAEKHVTINEEVVKLQAADFIREAHYPEWLSNVVLVKNANEK